MRHLICLVYQWSHFGLINLEKKIESVYQDYLCVGKKRQYDLTADLYNPSVNKIK